MVHVTLSGGGDLTAQIYRQVRDAVLDGRLRPAERLPPTRDLARRLAVSRNTVAAAYDRLTAEGFLTARVGSGTFVGTPEPGAARRSAPAGRTVHPRRIWQDIPDPPPDTARPRFDFRVGVPDPALFPLEAWRRLTARELRPAALHSAQYGEPAGHLGLRTAIARYFGLSRSVRAGADDVILTQGAQQALDLIGRVLIEPGAKVAVEEPGYTPARHLFQSHGARVIGVPVDAEGLVVTALPARTGLVYTTPSHQFPTGAAMSPARRAALLAWAERHGAVIIEDDYDSEFRYSARPLEPLQSLDRTGRVVYVGSFSKTMLPMLRLGFLVAPASLRPALRAAKRLSDWHGELPAQAALARFIDDGLLARHVRRATKEYAARRELILTILARDFGDWLRVVPSTAGLHLCALSSTVDVDAVVAAAGAVGVAVEQLSKYAESAESDAGLVLGFGAIPTAAVAEGLRRLRTALIHSTP